MNALALVLVLTAAFIHASWNYCAKRSSGGLPFVYLVSLIINLLYLPVIFAYCWWTRPALAWAALAWVAGSGVLKTAYSLTLQRGYRTGDFSLIYPLARGTGPLLAVLIAIAVLGERPSALAIAGGLLIVASIFWLTDAARIFRQDRAHLRTAFRYGLATGVFIAGYTVWDRQGMAGWLVPPLLYDAGTAVTQLGLLTPFAWRRRGEVAREWRVNRRWAFGVALLSPVSYLLILTAMKFTPVSYVAPAREISILIGAFFGARLLKEGDAKRRLIGAAGMVAGVIALALG